MNENIVGVLLCAGKGLRMGKLTQLSPKPILRIKNLPFQTILNNSIHKLLKYGINELYIITGYLGNKIEGYITSNVRTFLSDDAIIKVFDSRGDYKKGPLYSFFSMKNHMNLLKEDSIIVIMPGDTIFQENLLNVILSKIKSFPIMVEKPLIFYRTVEKSDLTYKLKFIKNISKKTISYVNIYGLNERFEKLTKICTKPLSKISSDELINEIFPIFVLPFSKFVIWQNLANRLQFKSIKELANYYCKSKFDILAIKLSRNLEFYDLDTKLDLRNLEKMIEVDNRFQ